MGLECDAMGRPPLALGTAGAIRCYKTDTGYRARVLIRDFDGAGPCRRTAWTHQSLRGARPEVGPA